METKPAYGIEELAKAGPLRRTYLYQAIKEKRLKAQKAGRRTIITDENFQAFLRSLPVVGEQGKPAIELNEEPAVVVRETSPVLSTDAARPPADVGAWHSRPQGGSPT
jgi:hypothetical protein